MAQKSKTRTELAQAEAEELHRRNMLTLFWEMEIPANSQAALASSEENVARIASALIATGAHFIPLSRSSTLELMLLVELVWSQAERQATYIPDSVLIEKSGQKNVVQRYIPKLVAYGLIQILLEDAMGKDYELAPFYQRMEAMRKHVLALDGRIPPLPEQDQR